MELADYLRQSGGEPFVWGETDCCAWVSTWVRIASGLDPIGPHRSRYRTAKGAARLIRKGGGFVAWVSSCVEAVGISQTENPKAGDIGLVRDDAGQIMVAICAGRLWAAKADYGLTMSLADPIKAWSVTCHSL